MSDEHPGKRRVGNNTSYGQCFLGDCPMCEALVFVWWHQEQDRERIRAGVQDCVSRIIQCHLEGMPVYDIVDSIMDVRFSGEGSNPYGHDQWRPYVPIKLRRVRMRDEPPPVNRGENLSLF